MRWDGTDRRVHLKVTGYKPSVEEAKPEPAEEIRVSPDGRRAVAEAGNRIYLLGMPQVGGQVPEVNVATPEEEMAFPVKRLNRVGGDFVSWSADGRYIEWSIGRSYFRYDPAVGDSLNRLKVSADSARADSLQKMEAAGKADTAAKSRADSIAKLPAYEGERFDVTIRAPRDVPRGTVVLRGARIVTMKGDEVIQDGEILVRDNRIVYVGPRRSGSDSGATVIDVTGKTIIPGLGGHPLPHVAHLGNPRDPGLEVPRSTSPTASPPLATPRPSTTDILTYADQVETGELVGPRIYSTGPGVFWDENFQSLQEARDALRRYSEFYHTNTIKQYMVGNRKQRQWVIMAAKELGSCPRRRAGSTSR